MNSFLLEQMFAIPLTTQEFWQVSIIHMIYYINTLYMYYVYIAYKLCVHIYVYMHALSICVHTFIHLCT